MIGAIIRYGNNTLSTELPIEALRLHNQLGSIGITDRADKIPALGNADISVELFAEELLFAKRAAGQFLINRLTAADTLYDVNVASYWLKEACAKNHDAFVALIVKTSPASLAGLRDLAKDFYPRPMSADYVEDQDMDDELEL